jgi:hypothetical protein
MIIRGALLLVSLFADIDSGKKAPSVVAIKFQKFADGFRQGYVRAKFR